MATKPAAATPSAGRSYARRQPETTVLYRILQEHLAAFEQQWSVCFRQACVRAGTKADGEAGVISPWLGCRGTSWAGGG
jgi:hypothetical protein